MTSTTMWDSVFTTSLSAPGSEFPHTAALSHSQPQLGTLNFVSGTCTSAPSSDHHWSLFSSPPSSDHYWRFSFVSIAVVSPMQLLTGSTHPFCGFLAAWPHPHSHSCLVWLLPSPIPNHQLGALCLLCTYLAKSHCVWSSNTWTQQT